MSQSISIQSMRSAFITAVALAFLTAASAFGSKTSALAAKQAPAPVTLAANQEKSAEPPAASSAEGPRSKESESTDEEAKFKESASVRALAGWLHITNNQAWWLSVLTNFGIVAIAIGYAAKSALPGMFRDRTGAIKKGMEEARLASTDSAARLADIESRLSKLDSEIATMRASAEQEAKAEEEGLRAATEDEKKKILQAAEQEIAAASNLVRRQLKQFAAELAVSLAEKRITVNDAADKMLVRDFTKNIAASGDGAKGGT